jgi:hypothetical protein
MKHFVFVSSEVDPDFKSSAIMYATKAPYSHAGVMIDDTIYHATKEGVHSTKTYEFLKTHNFNHLIDVTEYIKNDSYALGWCHGSIGKDYSESQLVGIILKPFRKFGYFNDDKREMICSEFAARFLHECSYISIFDTIDVDFIDPVQFIGAVLRFTKTTNKGV